MAKAKKSGSSGEQPTKKAAPAKKPAARKALLAGGPMIDTSMAAEAAAKTLIAGAGKPAATGDQNQPRPESAMFKQLKAGLNKPHSTTMSNLLEKSQGPEITKSHVNFKQVGRNQTYGADVTRSGVPRRTPG